MDILDAFQITQGLRPMSAIEDTTTVTRQFLGQGVTLRIKYYFHKALPATESPAEDAKVEITSIATAHFVPSWIAHKQYQELAVSDEELESIEDEVLEELL